MDITPIILKRLASAVQNHHQLNKKSVKCVLKIEQMKFHITWKSQKPGEENLGIYTNSTTYKVCLGKRVKIHGKLEKNSIPILCKNTNGISNKLESIYYLSMTGKFSQTRSNNSEIRDQAMGSSTTKALNPTRNSKLKQYDSKWPFSTMLISQSKK